MHKENCFITLTFDEEHLPLGGNLEVREFQLFMKRLRKVVNYAHAKGFVGPVQDYRKIRFFHCGEYGETNGRPHYHACLFGYNFPDRVYHHANRNGDVLYTSKTLEDVWGNGISLIGEVTFESAAYVARYVTKKVTGENSDKHYLNEDTGEVLRKEYTTMSRRPGIGMPWYEKYKSDVFPRDEKVVRGKVMLPPRYYYEKLGIDNPDMYAKIKADRKKYGFGKEEENSLRRLNTKGEIVKYKMKTHLRGV